ncbi:AAA family ATPase, partial [Ramlibacter sp.]
RSLYLGVSRITGPADAPAIDGPGPVLDHAVRMRRFPPGALFCERLQAGTLDAATVDRFAQRLAAFHADAGVAPASLDPDGSLPLRRAQAALAGGADVFPAGEVASLGRWLDAEWTRDRPAWLRRLRTGQVREGHGDLHLANIVVLDDGPAAFDCIEFDPALCSLDPVDDAAFALMDFAARGRADLGWRFFDAWLAHTGAFEGIALLRFYLVSHALVRAQVEHLRAPGCTAACGYAAAALDLARSAEPRLVITCGLPGSGKTFASQQWLQANGAVRARSDVERKRLFGLGPQADTRAHGIDAYTVDATRRTYDRLLAIARIALEAGFPVVLDAAFLRREERDAARALAAGLGVPFGILACEAPPEVLQQRLRARRDDASEAGAAVLERLRGAAEALAPDEQALVVASAPAPAGGPAEGGREQPSHLG